MNRDDSLNHRQWMSGIIACLLCVASSLSAIAALDLPDVFQDNMVLQRDMPAPVWGIGVKLRGGS